MNQTRRIPIVLALIRWAALAFIGLTLSMRSRGGH